MTATPPGTCCWRRSPRHWRSCSDPVISSCVTAATSSDKFLSAIPGAAKTAVQQRFLHIGAHLTDASGVRTLTVGLAELSPKRHRQDPGRAR
jgi:hypothetical protein